VSDVYTELTGLFPFLARYRKLAVAIVSTATPFVLWLLSGPHTTAAIVTAACALVLANFGVYQVPNSPEPAAVNGRAKVGGRGDKTGG
jgi:membrane protease YdiL (CAAX protease family)